MQINKNIKKVIQLTWLLFKQLLMPPKWSLCNVFFPKFIKTILHRSYGLKRKKLLHKKSQCKILFPLKIYHHFRKKTSNTYIYLTFLKLLYDQTFMWLNVWSFNLKKKLQKIILIWFYYVPPYLQTGAIICLLSVRSSIL